MTDVMLVKDCGLYPSYKKIIDFTGTKSEIIQKQIAWLNLKDHTTISDVNYNKFQNKLVLEMDYEEALTYTYAVMQNITGTGDNPMFFFIQNVENLTNGIENESPNVAINLSLDPIMTYMGDYSIDETMVVREHVDRWKSDSNLPIRITPNIEGSYGFAEYKDHKPIYMADFPVSEELKPLYQMGLVVLSLIKSDGQILFYGFPIYTEFGYQPPKLVVEGGGNPEYYSFPTLLQVMNGDVLDWFDIRPSELCNISFYPIYGEHFTISEYRDPSLGPLAPLMYAVRAPVSFSSILSSNQLAIMYDMTDSVYGLFSGEVKTVNIDISSPVKPVLNDSRDESHEPAMFTDPYIKYTLNDGVSDLFDIPDNIILKYGNQIPISVKTQMSIASPGTLLYIGASIKEAIGNNAITFVPAIPLEIGNDKWQDYSLTSKDIDRQLVNNQAIKNAIDNLVYMSYGGALVGSRSISEQPMFHPGFKGLGSYTYVNYAMGQNGSPYVGATYPGINTPPGLTKYGKRMASSTGLAAGASIVTSLVDGKVAWENQMLYEQQIKNTPSGLLQGGASISRIKSGQAFCSIIIRKVDTVNFDIGKERYFKFGYIVNKHEIPNTQSRKYFNYILTNGAIITGSINQTIRDVIASIFDAGVTIFHYDSGDNKTRNLEYTDKENIEVSLL